MPCCNVSISGMNQSHQKQKTNAEKLDLLSDEVVLCIQHQSGMPFSAPVKLL